MNAYLTAGQTCEGRNLAFTSRRPCCLCRCPPQEACNGTPCMASLLTEPCGGWTLVRAQLPSRYLVASFSCLLSAEAPPQVPSLLASAPSLRRHASVKVRCAGRRDPRPTPSPDTNCKQQGTPPRKHGRHISNLRPALTLQTEHLARPSVCPSGALLAHSAAS